MLRNFIRYTGLVLILLVFIGSGVQKLATPSVGAALLAKSNFPRMVAVTGITLSPSDYIHLIRATGVIFVSFSLFILLGVGRSFFAFLMAIGMVIITAAFYLDLDNPSATSEANVQHIFKNVSIIGALLFVAGSGHRSHRYKQARGPAEGDRAKKNN